MDIPTNKIVITNKSSKVFNFKEIAIYKDLLFLFVKRDFIATYKQTVLGPIWFVIQPLMSTIIFTVIFGNVAGLSTDGTPKILFYLAGLTCWNYFAECLTKTSNTFIENKNIFGKVYFPRIIVPLSIIISSILKFGVQLLLFSATLIIYLIYEPQSVNPSWLIIIVPFLIALIGLMGLGFGLIVTSLTTKYRDLKFLLLFGVQLWMYATPIIYPLSSLNGILRKVVLLNPMTSIVEIFKNIFLGTGEINIFLIGYSIGITVVILFLGIFIFNKTERNFMDTV